MPEIFEAAGRGFRKGLFDGMPKEIRDMLEK